MNVNLDNKKIPDTRYHKIIRWLCMILQAGVFFYLLLKWSSLPEQVPMHYNGAGEIDGYGGKWSILITPAAMVLMYQFLNLVERRPGWWNTTVAITRENAGCIYVMLKNLVASEKLVVTAIFGYLSICTGAGQPLGKWFLPVSLLLTFGVIIVFGILTARASKQQ